MAQGDIEYAVEGDDFKALPAGIQKVTHRVLLKLEWLYSMALAYERVKGRGIGALALDEKGHKNPGLTGAGERKVKR